MALGLAPGAAIEYSTTPPATGGGNGVATGEGHAEALGDGAGEGKIEAFGAGVRGGGTAPVGPLQPMVTNKAPTARARTRV
jgi:hypothetical protein